MKRHSFDYDFRGQYTSYELRVANIARAFSSRILTREADFSPVIFLICSFLEARDPGLRTVMQLGKQNITSRVANFGADLLSALFRCWADIFNIFLPTGPCLQQGR